MTQCREQLTVQMIWPIAMTHKVTVSIVIRSLSTVPELSQTLSLCVPGDIFIVHRTTGHPLFGALGMVLNQGMSIVPAGLFSSSLLLSIIVG